MATVLIPGQRDWSMSRDEKGHREYKIKFIVKGEKTDGPKTALDTPGLPRIGDPWVYDGDVDIWAFCRPECSVTPLVTTEPNKHFEIEYTFSTKPIDWCQDDFIDNPTLRPYKLSGSFTRYTEEAFLDRFNNPIRNSAHEPLRGALVEFDRNRPSVKIEQNVTNLQLALLTSMVDTVNDAPLWGLPARTIKLSSAPWERKFWGACNIYYTRTLEFDIRYNENDSFDRRVLDEGSKVLNGHWNRSTGNWILDNIPPNIQAPTNVTAEFQSIGGSMPVGTHTYQITATNALGETTSSSTVSVVVTTTGGVVIVRWNEVPGATGYKIYFNGVYLDTETSTLYIDDGTTIPGVAVPPSTNTTGTPPDRYNPSHFIRFRDRLGEMTRTPLDGFGLPADVAVGTGTGVVNDAGSINIERYPESNFLLLGVPTVIG